MLFEDLVARVDGLEGRGPNHFGDGLKFSIAMVASLEAIFGCFGA